ncbi:hypothetical protein AYK24_05695 [Thermoplasmatales archaeon SG8-52-4]|nr:MAG: hypothetical protein AYK24_05695 [Thermoplasmatales archaeon SG8-52-4]
MSDDLKKFIRALSEIYDSESNDTYVSLYYNKKTDSKFINRRIKECKSILKKDSLKNFIDTIEIIKDTLKQNIGNNIAIFASSKYKFLKYISLPIEVDNLLVVDSSPYIRPLARLHDEWESFTLLLLSSNYAKIFSVSLGKVDDLKRLSADIMNKHKKGGMSQMRFNRLRKGSINTFLFEVEKALQKRADEKIIIAGPGNIKRQFVDKLPKDLKERIVDILSVSINDEKELLKKSINIISENEEHKSHETVQHLKDEILKDGMAVYGINETLQATKNGQVELLIIEKDRKIPGWICENCQIVGEKIKKSCPNCGKKTSKIDILEEILEFAERTDAKIEFTDDKEMSVLGHIGAILRFK